MNKKENKQKKPTEEKQSNPVGAPTKYRPEYCQGIIDYFENSGKPLIKTFCYEGQLIQKKIGKLPSFFEGFAKKVGVHRDTLHEWCDAYPEFSDAYKIAKDIQLRDFMEKGLKGDLNSAFTIFTMKNIFGWRDRVEQETINPNDFRDWSDEDLDRELGKKEKWIEKIKSAL